MNTPSLKPMTLSEAKDQVTKKYSVHNGQCESYKDWQEMEWYLIENDLIAELLKRSDEAATLWNQSLLSEVELIRSVAIGNEKALTEANLKYVEVRNKNAELSAENERLKKVADIAALCTIDIGSNLSSANKEYMEGSLPKGAFNYILERQGKLHEALHEAGYTETHPLFKYPMKPAALSTEQPK